MTGYEEDGAVDLIATKEPKFAQYERAIKAGTLSPGPAPPYDPDKSLEQNLDRARRAVASVPSRFPTFDIDTVLPKTDNFLRAYYDEGSKEDTPNEFHLWCGLAVLSLAAGRRVRTKERSPVTCNLAICLTGATTVGKSRALNHAVQLVLEVMKWSDIEPTKGARMLDNPGSGEFLIKQLVNELPNAKDPKTPSGVFTPVKALIRFEELSVFVSKSGAQAGILQQMVMGLANGDSYIGRGSITNGSDAAENAFATLVATTQLKSLQHLFGDRDRSSGLLNRFLFIQGTPKRRHSRGGEPLEFREAKRYLSIIRDWVLPTERLIDFDHEGGIAWDELFYNRVQPLLQADTSELMSRMDLTLKRLVLLFAINDRSEVINRSHVRSAEALFDYLVACYRQVDSGLSTAEEDAVKHRLLEQIDKLAVETGAAVKQGQLLDRASSKSYSKDALTAELRRLEQQGLCSVERCQGARGPATFRWSLTDAGRDYLNGIFY